MIERMKQHERHVKEMLTRNPDEAKLKELLLYHDKQIQWMQHERMAHLITMLFVCLFALLAIGFSVFLPSIPSLLLSALLIILAAAYVFHYYRLENGVQKWYDLSNQVRERLIDPS